MKITLLSLVALSLSLTMAACQKKSGQPPLPDQVDVTTEQTIEIQQVEESQDEAQAVDTAVESMDRAFDSQGTELDASFSIEELEK